MLKKLIILLLVLAGFAPASIGQKKLQTFSFEQLDSLWISNPKPALIFIHTDWCKFCQTMLNTTFKNKEIVQLLNEKYYFIELNGEEKRPIIFRKKTYLFKPTGLTTGEHELANALGSVKGQLSYPTTVIVNPKNEIIFLHDQFLNSKEMQKVLQKACN